jgi:2-hydroxy-6-oxonona-2,4-dienedioate hydrolase
MISVKLTFAHAVMALAVTTAPVSAQQAADHHVQIFGQKIHYVEAGSGPNVILLHGLGGDATNWAQTVPALARAITSSCRTRSDSASPTNR